jgi:hypothetical protein
MTEQLLDLDALLDSNMDAVPEVPDYVTPPAGSYVLSIAEAEITKSEGKDGKPDLVRLNITYKVEESVEVEGQPVAEGALFSERFTYNEQGLGYFKRQAKNILNENIDGVTIRDVLATLKEAPAFKAVITLSKSGEYTNVRVRPVHEAA